MLLGKLRTSLRMETGFPSFHFFWFQSATWVGNKPGVHSASPGRGGDCACAALFTHMRAGSGRGEARENPPSCPFLPSDLGKEGAGLGGGRSSALWARLEQGSRDIMKVMRSP